MTDLRFTNNASGTLAAGIAPGDTSLTLNSGQGSLFPTLSGSQYCKVTLEDVGGNIEICHMTLRAGDVLTVVRGQEGTTALSFASGSRVEMRLTAAALQEFLQRTGDALSGTYDMTGGTLSNGQIIDAEIINSPIRGDAGVTTNELVVPPGGGPPTIGGELIYTAANLTLTVLQGLTFSVGTIVMWYGVIGGIPTGWQICDGTGGTPDLRDKFVIGAGATYAYGDTGGQVNDVSTPAGGHTPNILPTTLSAADLPPHTHRLLTWETGSQGNAENFSTSNAQGLAGNAEGSAGQYAYRTQTQASRQLVENTGTGAGHTHAASAVADHTHTVDTIPPFVALYFIMKV